MPSYIEFDKSASIPSASGAGRVTIGVDLLGNLTKSGNNGDSTSFVGLIETTREEIQILVDSGSLLSGNYYKITNAASSSFLDANGYQYSGYGNEIQIGGTTIILQATTEKTLSKEGVGLFYVPNYEDPNNPTAPPDYNYLTWDDTYRLYFINVNGRFNVNSGVTLYSNETDVSTNATLEGSLEGTVEGYVTLRLDTDNDAFFQDPNNLIGLEISSGGVSGSIDGTDYTSSYAVGDKVIFGGRVWQNLSGSIGWREGGNQWPTNVLNLNPEDWSVVPFNELDYTLRAHTIEYDFEHDNISYRSDGKNEVRCDWSWWNNAYGYNTIGYFPWGHYGVERVSFTNTYLHHFVNLPWQCEAKDIKFEHDSLFNATTWGRQSYFNRIYGAAQANFGGNRFSRNTDIYDITLGIDAEMRNINTSNGTSIYEMTIGNNAQFRNINMYNNSDIYDGELATSAYFGNSDHYESTSVYYADLGINALLSDFNLETSSDINNIELGINAEFGDIVVSSSVSLSNWELGNNETFGGTTFTSSLDNISLNRQFKNLYNTVTQSLDAGLGGNGNPLISFTNRSIITIDITGATNPYNFDLPDGNYEGQELTFVATSDGSHSITPDQVTIWSDKLVVSGPFYDLVNESGSYHGFRPFAKYDGTTYYWKNVTKAIWTGGVWVTDAEAFND